MKLNLWVSSGSQLESATTLTWLTLDLLPALCTVFRCHACCHTAHLKAMVSLPTTKLLSLSTAWCAELGISLWAVPRSEPRHQVSMLYIFHTHIIIHSMWFHWLKSISPYLLWHLTMQILLGFTTNKIPFTSIKLVRKQTKPNFLHGQIPLQGSEDMLFEMGELTL